MSKPTETITIRLASEHILEAKKLPPPVTIHSLVRVLLSEYLNGHFSDEVAAKVLAEAERALTAPKASTFKQGHKYHPKRGEALKCQNQPMIAKQQPPPLVRVSLQQQPPENL